jgi:UDP-GlcNAc:undecaprenyl-phosphate GlcNAc-1-phosphate transferase
MAEMNLGSLHLLAITVGAGAAVFLLIVGLTAASEYLNLIDTPDERKHHSTSVPMVGGISIYVVILVSTLLLDMPEKVVWLVLSVGLLVCIGAIDDAIGLGIRLRLFFQALATVSMILCSSLWISSLGIKFFGFDALELWIAIPITMLSVVGLTNAFNMIDGIDGLAAGQMLVSLLTICFTLQHLHGSIYQLEWLLILMVATFAFLLVNLSVTPFKKVFLGDAGSLLLGFIISWTLIYYTQHPVSLLAPVMAVWCVSIPIFDAVTVIGQRLTQGGSPFLGDRSHFHHLLVDSGMNDRVAVALILTSSLAVNCFGIWLTQVVQPIISLLTFLVVLMFYFVIIFKLKSKLRS